MPDGSAPPPVPDGSAPPPVPDGSAPPPVPDGSAPPPAGVGTYVYENAFFKYEGEWRDGVKHGQ